MLIQEETQLNVWWYRFNHANPVCGLGKETPPQAITETLNALVRKGALKDRTEFFAGGRNWVVLIPADIEEVLCCINVPDLGVLAERIDFLLRIIETSFDGITVTSADGHNILVNKAYERITNRERGYFAGRHVKELIADGMMKISPSLTVIKTGLPYSCMNYENGRTTFVSSSPLFDKEGCLQAVVANVRDISTMLDLYETLNEPPDLSEAEESNVIFRGKCMGEAVALATEMSMVDSTVLLHGETGTGKEVVARYIHNKGARRDKPFVKINCASIPESLFESELFGYARGAFTGASTAGKEGLFKRADEGTLFLDEIGEMSLPMQSKLLAVLQDKRYFRIGSTKETNVDVRIIAATNRDLEQMIENREFREDLYYRLNIVNIEIPSLRKRPEDIVPLATYFLGQFNATYNKKKFLTHEVNAVLEKYHWPGNVRELQNVVEHMVVVGNQNLVTVEALPSKLKDHVIEDETRPMVSVGSLDDILDSFLGNIIRPLYQECKSSYKLADKLKISQSKAIRLIKKYR